MAVGVAALGAGAAIFFLTPSEHASAAAAPRVRIGLGSAEVMIPFR
jgi:hypothetical protein